MRFSKEMNEAEKITLVFAVITSVFALLGKLSNLHTFRDYKGVDQFFNSNIAFALNQFFKSNIAWFIEALLVIIILCVIIIKADGKLNIAFLHNPMIRITSGLLIIFAGIIDLTKKVTVLINIIQTYPIESTINQNSVDLIRDSFFSGVVQLVIILLQILIGLYLILSKKKKNDEVTLP